ncbi:hypothetical protein Ct61P_11880 [Colletotrichum tofieldiae]|nr:hypothetical protein Ct61P_11880 [Colletotrichum tofieldiae]
MFVTPAPSTSPSPRSPSLVDDGVPSSCPSIRRSARSAARPGLKEAQRASYLTQFHIIELEKFLNDQNIASKATRDNIHFHESIIVQLQGLAENSDITKDNITDLIEIHRAKVSIATKDLDVAALNESRARTQISMYTTSNPNIRANISASAAFRSVVDDLDVVVHALEESLPPPRLMQETTPDYAPYSHTRRKKLPAWRRRSRS